MNTPRGEYSQKQILIQTLTNTKSLHVRKRYRPDAKPLYTKS